MVDDFVLENIRRESDGLPVIYRESEEQLNVCAQSDCKITVRRNAKAELKQICDDNPLLDSGTQIIVATESSVDGLHKIRVLVPESKYHIFDRVKASDFEFIGVKARVTTIGEFLND